MPAKVSGAQLVAIVAGKLGTASPTAIARFIGYTPRHVRRLLRRRPKAPAFGRRWAPIPVAILARADLTLPAKILAGSSARYGTGATAQRRLGWSKLQAQRARRALRRASFNTIAQGSKGGPFDPSNADLLIPLSDAYSREVACTRYHPKGGDKPDPAADGWSAALSTQRRVQLAGGPHVASLFTLFGWLGFFEHAERERAAFARRMAASSWSTERVLGLVAAITGGKLRKVASRVGLLRTWLERGTAPPEKEAPPLPVGKRLRRELQAMDRERQRAAAAGEAATAAMPTLRRRMPKMPRAEVFAVLDAMALENRRHRAAYVFVADAGGDLAALAAWASAHGEHSLFLRAIPADLRVAVARGLMPP